MQADMIIHGADVIDGTGSPRFRADVAIDDDRIVAIGDLARWQSGRKVDAKGLVLAHVCVNGREICEPTGRRPRRPLTKTAPGRVVSV